MENYTIGTNIENDEIFKFRKKICLFFISSIIYSGFILASALSDLGYVSHSKSIKKILTESFICILVFLPYFLILWEVVKGFLKFKSKIFFITQKHKTRDIFQIIFTVLLGVPSILFGVIPILIYAHFGIAKIFEVVFHTF